MFAAALALAVGRVAIEHGRRCRPGMRALVTQIDPQPAGLGLAVAGRQHGHRRVVGMDHGARHHVLANAISERAQQPRRLAHPVGQCAAIEIEAVARVDLGLAIEGKMVGVLRHDHMCEDAGAGHRTRDRHRRHGRLCHRLALGARVGRPHMAHHLEAAGHVLQDLGHVLADLAQALAAAARASAGGGLVSLLAARQMLGQLAARLLLAAMRSVQVRAPRARAGPRPPLSSRSPRASAPAVRSGARCAPTIGRRTSASAAPARTSASRLPASSPAIRLRPQSADASAHRCRRAGRRRCACRRNKLLRRYPATVGCHVR